MAVTQLPCKCGSDQVSMVPAGGGRGSGDSTFYTGTCEACGFTLEHLPENSDGKLATAIRDWNRAVKGLPVRGSKRVGLAAPADDGRWPASTARPRARQVEVPQEHRSRTPEELRSFLKFGEGQIGPIGRKLLLDAAAEIEGGEEAYAVLVDEIHVLREKLKSTERNLRSTIAMLPYSPLAK